jgi:hypothetical protein
MSNLILSTCDCEVICGSCVSGDANGGCSGESPNCPNTLAVSFTVPAWTGAQTQCPSGPLLDGIEYPEWTGTVTVTRAGTSGNNSCRYSGSVTPSVSVWFPDCVFPDYGSYCTSRTIEVELNRGQMNLLTSAALVDPCNISVDPIPTASEILSTWNCPDDPPSECNCRGVGVAIVDRICDTSGLGGHRFTIGYNSGEAECGDLVPCYTQYGGGGWGIQSWWGRIITDPTVPPQISGVTIS